VGTIEFLLDHGAYGDKDFEYRYQELKKKKAPEGRPEEKKQASQTPAKVAKTKSKGAACGNAKTGNLQETPANGLQKNEFIPVTREKFIRAVSENGFLSTYVNVVAGGYKEREASDYQIHVGDLNDAGTLKFEALNLLVIGNIRSKCLHLENDSELGYDEGGSLFVHGDVDCDFFCNHYGKLTVIDGSLRVSEILDSAFEDSALIIAKDLSAEYLSAEENWPDVGGTARMEYGNGCCSPLGYADAGKESISPKHSEEESYEFLKTKYAAGTPDGTTEIGEIIDRAMECAQ
jgi:hypothetical protein